MDKRNRIPPLIFYVSIRAAALDILRIIWYNGHVTKTTVRLRRKAS